MTRFKKPNLAAVFLAALTFGAFGFAESLSALPYGAGTYGTCQYSTCGITITTSGTVSLGVVPTSGGVYTVASDSVTVGTSSSTGYQLTINDTDTDTNLVNGANTIPTSSGTLLAPVTLAPNSFGYRVDGAGNFGIGPTTAQNSVTSNSYTFAGVPASSAAADAIRTTTSAANPPEATTVWYGVRLNSTIPSGTYVDQITYTAVVN
jgi:hypothetical protein